MLGAAVISTGITNPIVRSTQADIDRGTAYRQRILDLRSQGLSTEAILAQLRAEGFTDAEGAYMRAAPADTTTLLLYGAGIAAAGVAAYVVIKMLKGG